MRSSWPRGSRSRPTISCSHVASMPRARASAPWWAAAPARGVRCASPSWRCSWDAARSSRHARAAASRSIPSPRSPVSSSPPRASPCISGRGARWGPSGRDRSRCAPATWWSGAARTRAFVIRSTWPFCCSPPAACWRTPRWPSCAPRSVSPPGSRTRSRRGARAARDVRRRVRALRRRGARASSTSPRFQLIRRRTAHPLHQSTTHGARGLVRGVDLSASAEGQPCAVRCGRHQWKGSPRSC